jgi:hypothetical protein
MTTTNQKILIVYTNFEEFPTFYEIDCNHPQAGEWIACGGLVINSNDDDYSEAAYDLVSNMSIPKVDIPCGSYAHVINVGFAP